MTDLYLGDSRQGTNGRSLEETVKVVQSLGFGDPQRFGYVPHDGDVSDGETTPRGG